MYQWVGEPVHRGETRIFYRAVQLATQLCRTQDFLLLAERGEHRMRLGKCLAFWEEAGDELHPRQQWLRILRYRYRDELPASDSSAADALLKLATAHCVEVVQTAERADYPVDRIVGKAAVIHAPNIEDLHEMLVPDEPTYICHYQSSPDTHKLEPVEWSVDEQRAQAKRKSIEEQEPGQRIESLSPLKRSYACSSLSFDNSYQSDTATSPHRQLLNSSATLTSRVPLLPFDQTGFDEEKRSTRAEQISNKTHRSVLGWSRMFSELENAPSRKRPRPRSPGIRVGPAFQAAIPPLLASDARDESDITVPKAAKVWSRHDNLLPHLDSFLASIKSSQSVAPGDAVYIFDEKKGHWIPGIVKRAAQRPRPFDKVAVFDGTMRHEVHFCDCVLATQQEMALHFFRLAKGKIALALQLFRSAKKKSLQQSWTERETLAFADLYERFRDNLHRVHIGLQGVGVLRPLKEVVAFHHAVFLTSLHSELITRRPLAHEYDALPIQSFLRRPPISTGGAEYSLSTAATIIASTSGATNSASSVATSAASSSADIPTMAAKARSRASKAAAASTTEVARGRMTTRSQVSKPAAATKPAPAPADSDEDEIYSISDDDSESNEEAAERAVHDKEHATRASAQEDDSQTSGVELVSSASQAQAAHPRLSLGNFVTEVRTTLPKARSDLLFSNLIACGIGQLSFAQMSANVTAILRSYPHLYEQFLFLSARHIVRSGGS